MKKNYFIIAVLLLGYNANSQIVDIPDANFKAKLLSSSPENEIARIENYSAVAIDANSDGEIQESEAAEIVSLTVDSSNIADMTGIGSFINLRWLYCRNNQLSSLDVSALDNLFTLECTNNHIVNLDLSSTLVKNFNVSNNPEMVTLNIKNGVWLTSPPPPPGGLPNDIAAFAFSGLPNLEYICADDTEINSIQTLISSYGYECYVNSYCTIVPGGVFYAVEGSQHYDSTNDGCDESDATIPFLKYSVSTQISPTVSSTSTLISNASGNYKFYLPSGVTTITPSIENLSYFNVSPASFVVTFPDDASPFVQDFCISPNGTHHDLEISLLAISSARPGFDAQYKIVYKNKGNQIQSGSINLEFDDAILDLVVSDPTATEMLNNLSWNFSNLQPFETRNIEFTLNVNSPLEIPAVNANDILHSIASITSSQTDETPDNNTFTLNQTVVNSFDPNDKTCLEGTTITPEMVGKYVHYVIRFENTGTANAENIVVKDIIDTSKFDVASLIPLDGSHPFTTRIINTNKVEFFFNGIQLPFDDANNDGFVAFKIKTKPTLVIGNTFSNSASIYFDYNAPIITNTAITAIQVLGREDFKFENYFTLFPNPTSDVLNIKATQSIEISSISIYNTLGQLVLLVPNATDMIDVSTLTTGNYFMKIVSDKGSASARFVKE